MTTDRCGVQINKRKLQQVQKKQGAPSDWDVLLLRNMAYIMETTKVLRHSKHECEQITVAVYRLRRKSDGAEGEEKLVEVTFTPVTQVLLETESNIRPRHQIVEGCPLEPKDFKLLNVVKWMWPRISGLNTNEFLTGVLGRTSAE